MTRLPEPRCALPGLMDFIYGKDEVEIRLTDGHEVFERRYINADRKQEILRGLNDDAYKATGGNVYWTL